MNWLKSIGSVFNSAKRERDDQGGRSSAMALEMSPLDRALDSIPHGSVLKPRQWSRIRALHRNADELERSGDLMEARKYSVQALRLAQSLAGEEDPGLAACLLHYASGVQNTDDLTGAEPNYNWACSILNPTQGVATLLKAELLLAYGSLLMSMGLGWRAMTLLSHAKSRFDELFGPDDENVGRSLMALGMSYEIEGLEDEAIGNYDEAIRILDDKWGRTNPSVAYVVWARANLAFWRACKAGNHQAVEKELLKLRSSIRQLEDEVGLDHPAAVDRRATLGSMLIEIDHLEEGVNLLADAVAQLEAIGQPAAGYRRILARNYVNSGRAAEAVLMHRRAFHEDPPLGSFLAHGSERNRMAALEKANRDLEQFLDAILLAGGNVDPATIAEASDLVLSRKALGAEILLVQRQAVANNDSPELKPLMDQLAELRARLAASSLAGEKYDAKLGAEIERTEWEIASCVSEIDTLANTIFTHDSAAELLPPASALIDIMRFTRWSMVKTSEKDGEEYHPDWYLAFVIPSGVSENVRLVDLGPADKLDHLIKAYRSGLSQPGGHAESANSREAFAMMDDDTQADEGAGLRQQLLEPLRLAIEGCSQLFIATDGHLSWLPFEAISDDSGCYLIETLDIRYLNAGRDLRRLHSKRFSKEFSPSIVLADPDYDSLHRKNRQSEDSIFGPNTARPGTVAGKDRLEMREVLRKGSLRFKRLPGTRTEGVAVARLLGVEPLLDEFASEQQLKAIKSPLILHIATHGFYLPEPEIIPEPGKSSRDNLIDAAMQNPLVRSGLALSGANTWLGKDALPNYLDDGILTGEDVVAIELTATEMVVLSACQTGLGDFLAGEGVTGLRRAFMVAGARTLIVSLWSVPDKQTQMLITFFYEHLLRGNGRAASLKAAQLQLREEFPDPYYWAAFICIGDPGPIESLTMI